MRVVHPARISGLGDTPRRPRARDDVAIAPEARGTGAVSAAPPLMEAHRAATGAGGSLCRQAGAPSAALVADGRAPRCGGPGWGAPISPATVAQPCPGPKRRCGGTACRATGDRGVGRTPGLCRTPARVRLRFAFSPLAPVLAALPIVSTARRSAGWLRANTPMRQRVPFSRQIGGTTRVASLRRVIALIGIADRLHSGISDRLHRNVQPGIPNRKSGSRSLAGEAHLPEHGKPPNRL